MINWLSKVEPIRKTKEVQLKPFHIERIELASVDQISELAVLFIAGSVLLSESMMVSLPTKNDNSRKKILEEVAPHFKEIKLVWEDHRIEKINMRYIKEESKELFLNGDAELLEIVKDLYRTTRLRNWMHSSKRITQYYRIEQAKIAVLDANNTEGIKEYILTEYIQEDEELVWVPTGWYLSDELRESNFLRFFAGFVPTMNLIVDQNNNEVIAIELKN